MEMEEEIEGEGECEGDWEMEEYAVPGLREMYCLSNGVIRVKEAVEEEEANVDVDDTDDAVDGLFALESRALRAKPFPSVAGCLKASDDVVADGEGSMCLLSFSAWIIFSLCISAFSTAISSSRTSLTADSKYASILFRFSLISSPIIKFTNTSTPESSSAFTSYSGKAPISSRPGITQFVLAVGPANRERLAAISR